MWSLTFVAASDSQDAKFELLPEATDRDDAIEKVIDLWDVQNSDTFSERYNKYAEELGQNAWEGETPFNCAGLGNQFVSWIMNRDTILCIAAQVVRFVSNMALVVWAWMIIYAWYMYATSVFAWENVGKGSEAIKWATVGIVVIVFSYAILNIVMNAFL